MVQWGGAGAGVRSGRAGLAMMELMWASSPGRGGSPLSQVLACEEEAERWGGWGHGERRRGRVVRQVETRRRNRYANPFSFSLNNVVKKLKLKAVIFVEILKRKFFLFPDEGPTTRDCWNPYSKCGSLNRNVSKHYLYQNKVIQPRN